MARLGLKLNLRSLLVLVVVLLGLTQNALAIVIRTQSTAVGTTHSDDDDTDSDTDSDDTDTDDEDEDDVTTKSSTSKSSKSSHTSTHTSTRTFVSTGSSSATSTVSSAARSGTAVSQLSSRHGLSAGGKAGISIGILIIAVLLIFLLLAWRRRVVKARKQPRGGSMFTELNSGGTARGQPTADLENIPQIRHTQSDPEMSQADSSLLTRPLLYAHEHHPGDTSSLGTGSISTSPSATAVVVPASGFGTGTTVASDSRIQTTSQPATSLSSWPLDLKVPPDTPSAPTTLQPPPSSFPLPIPSSSTKTTHRISPLHTDMTNYQKQLEAQVNIPTTADPPPTYSTEYPGLPYHRNSTSGGH